MAERIHMVIDAEEKERYRRLAARDGKTLSEWLRQAAAEKAASLDERDRLATPEALAEFFHACDARERGTEPDWEEHRRVIERSARSGAAGE